MRVALGGLVLLWVQAGCTATVELPSGQTVGVGAGTAAGGCSGGLTDCDGDAANGCETDTRTDVANCGECGMTCMPRPNEEAACATGSCAFDCASGWGDCDGDAGNGCETDTTVTMEHCGGCGMLCDGTNGRAACEGGDCILDCDTSYADCDGTASNGCETNIGIDSMHCGACALDCVGECVSGICTLASGLPGLAQIEVNATHVYVTRGDPGDEVLRVPLAGGMVQTIASTQDGAAGLALDASYVYWSTIDAGTVARAPLGGGAVQPLASGLLAPVSVVVDAVSVYWADSGNFSGTSGSVGKAPLAGGLPVPLATDASIPRGVAVDATHVYWTSHNLGSVMRADLEGLNPTPIATNQSVPTAIAVDGTNIYWVNTNGNSVMQAPKGGGVATPLATPDTPTAVVVDATHVYFATFGSDELSKVPIGGGTVIPLVVGSTVVTDLAVDDKAVYWIRSNAGIILRTAK